MTFLDDDGRAVALVLFNAALGHPGIAAGDPKRLLAALEAAAA